MLIDSAELHAKLYILAREVRDSRLLFSQYKQLLALIQKVHNIIDELEAATAGEKAIRRYSEALKGPADK